MEEVPPTPLFAPPRGRAVAPRCEDSSSTHLRQLSDEHENAAVNKKWSHTMPRAAHAPYIGELVPLPEEDDTKAAKQKRQKMPQEPPKTTEELIDL